jgi:endonuclease III
VNVAPEPEVIMEEGLRKEEKKMALDEMANVPGQFEKSSKRKS